MTRAEAPLDLTPGRRPRPAAPPPPARDRRAGVVLVACVAVLLSAGPPATRSTTSRPSTRPSPSARRSAPRRSASRASSSPIRSSARRPARRFVLTGSGHSRVTVDCARNSPPQLFQANIPVVVVGHFASATSNLFVRHPDPRQAHVDLHRPAPGPRAARPTGRRGNAHLARARGALRGLRRRARRRGRRRWWRCAPGAGLGRWPSPLVALVGIAGARSASCSTRWSRTTSRWPTWRRTTRPSRRCCTRSPGLWSALEGSLLLWALLLALATLGVVLYYRRQATDSVVAWASAVLFFVGAFFTFLMVRTRRPVPARASADVTQGAGPNALLQDNPLVAMHPPLLYAGFVGFTVPFAFAIAMLITGRVHDRWPLEQRRWTVLAWGALSVGIVLGAWWSYQVLGWGGFWGWDPVENAALLPWLTATAYVHSVIVQDRRGLFRVWNLSLAVVDLRPDRAGHVLHALGGPRRACTRSPRRPWARCSSASSSSPWPGGSGSSRGAVTDCAAPVGVDRALSREGLFVVNNVLFVGFAIVVLLGTVFPLLYEAVNGGQVTVGTPYFATVAAPVGVVALGLMALAPLVSWRSADREVLWRRIRVSAWFAVALVARARGPGRAALVGAGRVLPRGGGRRGRAADACARCSSPRRRRGSWRQGLRAPSTGRDDRAPGRRRPGRGRSCARRPTRRAAR